MNNTCVCCGKVIPEGRQICPTCGDITNKNFKSNNSEIMRNKQVEELAAYLSQFTPILSENNCHYVAEQAYKDGYRKQEWISVDERLPEIEGVARTWGDLKIRKSVRVLCACVQKSGKTLVKEGYCEVWGESQRAYWKIPGSIDTVTHWMPLPEAPKMKGGAE